MRELTFEELELVAGGDGNSVDGVTVVAGGGGDDGGTTVDGITVGGGGGGGGGGTEVDGITVDGGGGGAAAAGGRTDWDVPNDTPCVHASPTAESSLYILNGEAKAAGEEMDDPSINHNVEWGTILYEYLGTTYFAPLVSGTADDISLSVPIPQGAVIVGWEHSHVDFHDGADQTEPSAKDIATAQALANYNQGGITADPNLLTYIHDDATDKTYVYDQSHLHSSGPGCNV